MKKIVILDGYTIHPMTEELQWFKELGDVTIYESTPDESAAARIGDAEIVFTDSTYIGKEVLDCCPNLEWIGILATGTNSVDLEYAKSKGIPVCNVPAYGTNAVSQCAFALLLYACGHLKEHLEYVKNRLWCTQQTVPYWNHPSYELEGKVMGIIGFGRIGKQSAKTALAFGMRVLVFSKYPDKEMETENLKFVSKDELLANADVLFLHCPLTEENEGLINKERIAKMKDGVILVNTARGKLIHEFDLFEALQSKKIAFACLDVLAEEPPSCNNPLFTLENCFITPHVAWTSEEARIRICQIASENLRTFLDGQLLNCVNL